MSRVDQRRITVVVDGIDLGIMDSKSGGAVSAETTKHPPGGMQDEKDYGGRQVIEDLELTAVYDQDFIHPKMPQLRALVGVPEAVVVTDQPLDRDKNAKGRPDVYKGSLASVGTPDYDSTGTGDVAKLSLTVSVSGPVG